jgi:hypothetical protein
MWLVCFYILFMVCKLCDWYNCVLYFWCVNYVVSMIVYSIYGV